MTAYLTTKEIQTSLQTLIKEYIRQCKEDTKLCEDFKTLLKHTFKAKYVLINKEGKIEIGIKNPDPNALYNNFRQENYALDEIEKVLNTKIQAAPKNQIKYYGNFINATKKSPAKEVVFIG